MGRPYRTELEKIPDSVEWAFAEDVSRLATTLDSLGAHQLLTVGSGGSFTAAAFAAMLHESYFGKLAKAITPLEAAVGSPATDAAALLLSARGSNTDILDAFRQLSYKGHPKIAVVCARLESPLGKKANESGHQVFEFGIPTGRDGYLATNSLIATLVILLRAYALIAGENLTDYAKLLSGGVSPEQWVPDWSLAGQTTRQQTLIVLSQEWSRIAAIDIESRFAEAAIGNVSATDYRNFAHGRHHWLEQKGDETAVITFETPDSTRIAERTLALLPSETLVMRIKSQHTGPLGAIELVRSSMALTLAAGEQRGIDPGRPSVAQFGRRLYRTRSGEPRPKASDRWIRLKAHAMGGSPATLQRPLEQALSAYIERLTSAAIRGLVIDYDGTLGASDRRNSKLNNGIGEELNRLLAAGLKLAVATGRGGSAHKQLRNTILPKYWSSVVLGLHNGNVILGLDEEIQPYKPPVTEILTMAKILESLKEIHRFDFHVRHRQISIFPDRQANLASLLFVISEHTSVINLGMRVVRSSHALDILASGVSKNSVVDAIARLLNDSVSKDEILRIGDQGSYFGNDFELLKSGLSLSVDEVSADLFSCWNLSPNGTRGHRTTLEYLRAIVDGPSGLKISPKLLFKATKEP